MYLMSFWTMPQIRTKWREEIPRETPSQTFPGETLRPSKSGPWEQSLHGVRQAGYQVLKSIQHTTGDQERQDSSNKRRLPMRITLTRHIPRRKRDGNEDDNDDEEEKVGVYMWERRATLGFGSPMV